MRFQLSSAVSCATLLALIQSVSSRPFLLKRADELKRSYDFVIVGGGTSGLVVANRLTEDPNVSVLVIEAGKSESDSPQVLEPSNFASVPSGRTWGLRSEPMTELNNRTAEAYAAKILGGGSAINGMLFDRASKADYDAWELMGNPGWNWENMLHYFKKFETFHPPVPKIVEEFGIEYIPEVHGTDGPIHISYPPFIYPSVKIFFEAMEQAGVSFSRDGHSGNALGAFWVPSAVNPETSTRSYADIEYNQKSSALRDNYHLITENMVTKLITDTSEEGKPRAIGVEFGTDKFNVQSVFADKDVILCAGSVMTPKILKLSGIGAKSKLEALGIPTLVDLPGVGEYLQDHASTSIYASLGESLPHPNPTDLFTNATYQAEMRRLYEEEQDGPYTNAAAQSLAFLTVEDFKNETDRAAIYAAADGPVPDYFGGNEVLEAGYNHQLEILREMIRSKEAAAVEVTPSIGSSTLGMERPFSRGYVDIVSPDPWDDPIVDYRPYTHPVDRRVAIGALKFYRDSVLTTPAMAAYKPTLILPAANVQTDEQLENHVRQFGQPTFAHLTSTAMMAKREYGGVVDSTNMRVYGIDGLRIVDASIIPFNPATHICTSVYATAEFAADIIRNSY